MLICNLALCDLWDFEIVVNQVKPFPVFLEGCTIADVVIIFLSSSMPKILNDSDRGFLAFVLIDGLEVSSGCVGRRTMLNVNERFISDILGNQMLSVIIIIFQVSMSKWILLLTWLGNISSNIWLYLT